MNRTELWSHAQRATYILHRLTVFLWYALWPGVGPNEYLVADFSYLMKQQSQQNVKLNLIFSIMNIQQEIHGR